MLNSPLLTQDASPLKKLLTLVSGVVVLVLGLMFSVVVLIAVVVIGLMVWGYLWWKTRELRRAMREATVDQRGGGGASGSESGGAVIEGEAVVIDESDVTNQRSPGR